MTDDFHDDHGDHRHVVYVPDNFLLPPVENLAELHQAVNKLKWHMLEYLTDAVLEILKRERVHPDRVRELAVPVIREAYDVHARIIDADAAQIERTLRGMTLQ